LKPGYAPVCQPTRNDLVFSWESDARMVRGHCFLFFHKRRKQRENHQCHFLHKLTNISMCYMRFINTDSSTEQIFTLQQIFKKSLMKPLKITACFVDIKKLYHGFNHTIAHNSRKRNQAEPEKQARLTMHRSHAL